MWLLRLINSWEPELSSGFIPCICNWGGGGIISPTKNAKYFAKKGFAALGRGIGKKQNPPRSSMCAKRATQSMPWQRETPKPSRPSPPPKVCMSSFDYLCILFSPNEGVCRLTPKTPTTASKSPRELPHGRRSSSESFSLIAIVHRALRKISTA